VTHRILVVEDNIVNRELLCVWLETEGYDVASAEDLKAAFADVQRHSPHVVLLDIKLGDADDAALVTSDRKQDSSLREIPIIAVTAHAMTTERQRILQAGCNACISKPIDFQELKDQLSEWLTVSMASQPYPGRTSDRSAE
jgi:CheY-like chemotaxis protein